jgi:hypothetical protein
MANEFDEEGIIVEMAEALGEDEDDLSAEESSNFSGFGIDAWEVSGAGTFMVVENEDDAHDLAIAVVLQDLEHEPEIFDQAWLASHIDAVALTRWVFDAAMEDDFVEDIAENDQDRFWDEYESWSLGSVPDEESDEYLEPTENQIDKLQRAIAKERSGDPMGYLEDIYGDEATAKAVEIVGIDYNAAAEDAVQTDGWAHFLSRYDGNYHTTPSGFVYWRED